MPRKKPRKKHGMQAHGLTVPTNDGDASTQKTKKADNKGDTMNDVSILCNFIFVNILSFFFLKLGDLRG
ncbi:MAG: hypothetical protein HOB40_07555 [Candidatus Marinimicrobia bacterium]|jgi:hypothetical protein|nr:hypothetical protein [Candidatus Neomarinimicrobiota bacterium]MBT3501308.1 hypothetical protein [Candidatus Neomarinimicrobiota bacterium]MBT3838508.1 hypothetical protein [Candidatus Neomarinimicrobiota bacterium]MBT3999890.1 hypothetical protein [Candidatus Neomarinimicrobiota bacterium]MBT4579413.1 hypothetical protein [Candidatus Neomarinimicrobiota bacterium]